MGNMKNLPVIVGFGGINAAGRSSGFHAYKRMVCDVLSAQEMASTWSDLAHRMGLDSEPQGLTDACLARIKQGTLLRRIDGFNPEEVVVHHQATIHPNGQALALHLKKHKSLSAKYVHSTDPATDVHDGAVMVNEPLDILLQDTMKLSVSSGGNIPTGFDPGTLYASHHHPRGLKLTVYAASDALNALGLEWNTILEHIQPDEVSVYGGSALSQIDEYSLAGMIGNPLRGERLTSKMMALSLAEMPADFVNSYLVNSVGSTGNHVGACATYLYNLRQGLLDIREGRARVVIIINAEAPVVPEVIEGFRVMGALATDESLCALDGQASPNHRRACRPFSTNTGFTLGESAQCVVLMDDALALTLGATIYGSVADVFINADANKKSIASPGIGNYITVAKATALAKVMLGEEGLQHTYVQAHGTGTPQNRTTESHILNEVAKTFAIKAWPVTAVKSYVGHSVGAAGGDQMMAALGVWHYGWIPGITSIDHIAPDVSHSHLSILMNHRYVGEQGCEMKAVIINSKGFGGNNASALILSPQETMRMLDKKHGSQALVDHQQKNQHIREKSAQQDEQACLGQERMVYIFGEAVMDQSCVSLTTTTVSLSTFIKDIELPSKNPYV